MSSAWFLVHGIAKTDDAGELCGSDHGTTVPEANLAGRPPPAFPRVRCEPLEGDWMAKPAVLCVLPTLRFLLSERVLLAVWNQNTFSHIFRNATDFVLFIKYSFQLCFCPFKFC